MYYEQLFQTNEAMDCPVKSEREHPKILPSR